MTENNIEKDLKITNGERIAMQREIIRLRDLVEQSVEQASFNERQRCRSCF